MFRITKLAVAAATLTVSLLAQAGPAWEFNAAGESKTGIWDFAMMFDVKYAVDVTALGFYADPDSPTPYDIPVMLSNADGDTLASASVTDTSDLIGHFRYSMLAAPVRLEAGRYQISAPSHSNIYTWKTSGFVVDSALSNLQNGWAADTEGDADFLWTIQGDLSSYNIDGYWGPNFLMTVVPTPIPEPGSLALSALALGGLGLTQRRRKTRPAA